MLVSRVPGCAKSTRLLLVGDNLRFYLWRDHAAQPLRFTVSGAFFVETCLQYSALDGYHILQNTSTFGCGPKCEVHFRFSIRKANSKSHVALQQECYYKLMF